MALPAPIKATLRYTRNVLVGTDMWLNALTGGEPGETISYRVALAQLHRRPFGCLFCRFLNLFEADHCGITLRKYDKHRTLGG